MKQRPIGCWKRTIKVMLGWVVVGAVIASEGWVVAGLARDWQNPSCHRPEPFALVAAHGTGLPQIPW